MMLYLHIPFCRKKCDYCAFYSEAGTEYAVYIQKLCSFLEYYGKGRVFESVYIGGGTPSVLPVHEWTVLLAALAGKYSGEFTVELNPESTDAALLTLLKRGGVNRLSFGIQSLVDEELSAVGRLHNAAAALKALQTAMRCGFENISADLIYGLPGQTPESFAYSLEKTLAAGVTHLSCYNLTVEPGTPLAEQTPELPDEDIQLAMYDLLCRTTTSVGMSHYEISNFAREGYRAVHNSGYWSGKEYIGLGPSAHSFIDGVRFSFAPDVHAFLQKKSFDFDEKLTLSQADKRTERIMLGLRTDSGAPMELLDKEVVQKYISLGLGSVKDNSFILNDRGFLLSNLI